jgi:plasmid stabilization system protein ParE
VKVRWSPEAEDDRAGRITGTREVIPHKSYCLVYEIKQETVWVLALVHTARQWPPVAE